MAIPKKASVLSSNFALANAEGLGAHARSIAIRLNE